METETDLEESIERAGLRLRRACGRDGGFGALWYPEGFERSRSKSSPLEQTRSKLANPVELTGSNRG